MPRGGRSETPLSICSRSKVRPTTRSTDRLLWHMLGPSIGPWGRWESESLLAYYFPHHSVREARLGRLSACLCGQNKRVTHGGKQQSPDWYFRLTRSLTYCQIPPPCSVLVAPFWLILTDWFCFVSPFVAPQIRQSSSRSLLSSGDHISYRIPKTLIVILLLCERQKKKHKKRTHQKLTGDKAPSTHRIPGN